MSSRLLSRVVPYQLLQLRTRSEFPEKVRDNGIKVFARQKRERGVYIGLYEAVKI